MTDTTIAEQQLRNFIGGAWKSASAKQYQKVVNPATGELLTHVPLTSPEEVNEVANAAKSAFLEWREIPAPDRIQYLFKLKQLLEEHFEEIARIITLENGKTLHESRGELRRAIENVEVACGIPSMMQGDFLEDVARGIDEYMIRQPVGVVALICPFNFPAMIPFWFLPYALATGNTVIVKPSERTPLTMQRVFELIENLDLPSGVINLINGGPETVNAILDHPAIRAISFVGSTAVARHVYARAASNGKRVQAQGGAKNPTIILPDADMEMATRIIADSAFGNAGQRCLATSLTITVGDAHKPFSEAIAAAARNRVLGSGLDEGVEMGPLITSTSRNRVESLIQRGIDEGARPVVDGRDTIVKGYEGGYFLRPTILEDLPADGEVAGTEIFGPVLSMIRAETVDDAIELVNRGRYGNMACLFTSSGAAARKFRHEAQAGNVGINIGVAAPMAFFPFSGWKDSFFGTLHGQSAHAVEFFTQTKVVVERWLSSWSRKF